ncbi:hypothetical protein [Clostridium botulinum]|nr:hypothetical protein [Clostridium botulinum]
MLNEFGNLTISDELLDKIVEIYEDVMKIKVSRDFISNKLKG